MVALFAIIGFLNKCGLLKVQGRRPNEGVPSRDMEMAVRPSIVAKTGDENLCTQKNSRPAPPKKVDFQDTSYIPMFPIRE